MLLRSEVIRRGVEQSVARRAHNPEVVGSSPSPATIKKKVPYRDFLFYTYQEGLEGHGSELGAGGAQEPCPV